MSLSLHMSHCGFIVCTLTMHWAASNHHLLCLMTLEAIKILLVVHLLKLMEAEMLLLQHLIHLRLIILWRLARMLIALWV